MQGCVFPSIPTAHPKPCGQEKFDSLHQDCQAFVVKAADFIAAARSQIKAMVLKQRECCTHGIFGKLGLSQLWESI